MSGRTSSANADGDAGRTAKLRLSMRVSRCEDSKAGWRLARGSEPAAHAHADAHTDAGHRRPRCGCRARTQMESEARGERREHSWSGMYRRPSAGDRRARPDAREPRSRRLEDEEGCEHAMGHRTEQEEQEGRSSLELDRARGLVRASGRASLSLLPGTCCCTRCCAPGTPTGHWSLGLVPTCARA